MSKIKWPTEAQLKKVRDELSTGIASKPLPADATPADMIKHSICKEFVIYKNTTKVTQKALAEKLGIDEALMSKILHYHTDEFTIDRLMKFLGTLRPNAKIKFEVA